MPPHVFIEYERSGTLRQWCNEIVVADQRITLRASAGMRSDLRIAVAPSPVAVQYLMEAPGPEESRRRCGRFSQ